MYTFLIRRVCIGLNEAADVAKLRGTFSQVSPAVPVRLDQLALRMLASDLELDADGLVLDAHRYVDGQYRPKARGFTGGRLGDFGEVLTLLVHRSEGPQLERIVGTRRPRRPLNAVGKIQYPQPDFMVSTATGLRIMEVKTSEAHDHQELLRLNQLSAKQRGHTWLQPCKKVSICRREALDQLGFGASLPKHKLRTLTGTLIPFPAKQGTAVAVLVHDGRNKQFVGNKVRFKTPPTCQSYTPPQ